MRPETDRRGRALMCGQRAWLAITIGAWMLSGCTTNGRIAERAMSPTRAGAVVVENNSWDHVTIFIARNRSTWRIGDVSALSRGTFPLDQIGLVADGHDAVLVARPLAGEPFRSAEFSLSAGGTFTWTIENAAAISHLTVR